MDAFIFDFDGTIADSFTHVIAIFNEFFPDRSISPGQIDEYRGLTSRKAIKKAKVPLWRLPRLLTRGLKRYKELLPQIEVFAGMAGVIKELKQQDRKIFLLTSNNEVNVRHFLERHQLEKYFDGIYGGSSLFGKAAHLRKIVSINHLNKGRTVYIGDETRDIDAAKKAGVISVAVAWGFNHPLVLEKHQPDRLVLKPAEILELLK